MKRLIWSLAILCLFACATVHAQGGAHTFLGFSRDGEVVYKPSSAGSADGWSESFDNMLEARSTFQLSDLAPPKGMSYVATAYWEEIQVELKYLIDEQDKLISGRAFGQDATLYGVAMAEANRSDSRWEELEFTVAQKTAEVVARYRQLKESFTSDPTQSDERLSAFAKELQETKAELADKTKTILGQTSDGATLANENFMSDFFNKYVAMDGPGYLDANQIHSDRSKEPLIGKTICPTENIPRIFINVKSYKQKFNEWKNSRHYPDKVGKLRESTKSYLNSRTSNSGGLTTNGPRKGRRYYINHVIKDENGKVIAAVVNAHKGAHTGFVIPYHGDSEGPVKRYFSRPIEHPLGANFVAEDLGNKKVLQEWTKLMLNPLRELEKLTSLHSVLGVKAESSRSERVAACDQHHAQQVLNKAETFYTSMRESRGKVLQAKFGLLKDLYEALINVEMSINEVLLHYGPDATRRQDRIALMLGSAQNYVATLIAMIGEKYRFDTESKTVVKDGVYATERKSRIGNTYDYGTNNMAEVRAADYLMSGPYSLHDFVTVGNDRNIAVEVNYVGLQGTSDSNKTNKFTVAILDKNNESFEKLMEELSAVKRTSSGGIYRRPISECPTFLANPNNLVMAHKEVNASFIARNGTDATVDVSFKHTGEKKGFTVYQETAGLKYAPWIDYDEVTTTVVAKNCSMDQEIDPDGFRIIVDASQTMQGLFKKVVAGLEKNLQQLDSEYLASEYTAFRPVHLFSTKGANHTKDSPYSLADFGKTNANGQSWISEAVRTLGNNIPEKPWILIIISDFNGDYFKEANWATATNLQTPASPREPARTLPPLFKEAPRELWLEPNVKEYVINNSGKIDEGWPRLTKVYCIAVQSLYTYHLPIGLEEYDRVLRRRYRNNSAKRVDEMKQRRRWSQNRSRRNWHRLTANWMLSHVDGRNGIFVDLLDAYNPDPSVMGTQSAEPYFQRSLTRAMDRIYKTHALNKKRGGSQ